VPVHKGGDRDGDGLGGLYRSPYREEMSALRTVQSGDKTRRERAINNAVYQGQTLLLLYFESIGELSKSLKNNNARAIVRFSSYDQHCPASSINQSIPPDVNATWGVT